MRKLFLLHVALAITMTAAGQGYKVLDPVIFSESDNNDSVYTVKGYRHGVSFFPQVKHSDVQYEKGPELTFDTFHSNDVINEWMIYFAKEYPQLTELYEVGKSFEG